MSKTRIYLLLILLLAAGLRLWGLGEESLWLDEAVTVKHAQMSLPELLKDFSTDTQTPLNAILEHFWIQVAGIGEWAMRFPSAVFGILAVGGIFLVGRLLFEDRTALLATLLAAINPFLIYYAQDARPYSLFLFGAVFSLYLWFRLMQVSHISTGVGFLIFTSIALYAHPLGPLLLMVHGSALLIYRTDERFPLAARAFFARAAWLLAAFVLYLPQLIFMWQTMMSKAQGHSRASWIPVPDLRTFAVTAVHYFITPYLMVFALIVVVAAGILYLKKNPTARRNMLWLAVLLSCFTLLPFVLSQLITPVYVARYTIPALVAVLLVIAWAMASFQRIPQLIVIGTYLLLTGHALFCYYTKIDKDPWRQTAEIIRSQAEPGDVIIASPFFTGSALSYYLPGVKVYAPRTIADFPSVADTARRVILVESNYTSSLTTLADLHKRLSEHCSRAPSVCIYDRIDANPWAYWLPDIRVAAYNPVRKS